MIGGVGLARYLDPEKDAEKYAPLPSLGWERAYRSGDLVARRAGGAGLPRPGRRADQARRPPDRAGRGGRRAAGAARASPGAAAAVRTRAQRQPAARRLRRHRRTAGTTAAAVERLRAELPAALVPLLAPGRRAADPHLRQGRPRRAALAAAAAWRPARPGRAAVRHRGLARRAVDARSSASRSTGAGRRLLRDRRQQPRRRPADLRGCAPATRARPSATSTSSPTLRKLARHAGGVRAGRRRPRATSRRCRGAPRSSRLLLLLPLFTLRRAALDAWRWPRSATSCTGSVRLGADRLLVVARRAGLAAAVQPAGPARDRRGRRAAAAAGREARPLPARRQRPSAAVDGRAAGRVQRGDLADRLLAGAVRAGAGRQDRRRTSTCTRCRRSPACSSWAGARPSSPRWTCPATGWTATGWRSARSRSARSAVVGTRSIALPRRPGRQAGRGGARFGGRPGRSRPVSAGRARPRSSSARPSATGPRSRPRRGPVLAGRCTALTGFALTALPVLAGAARAARGWACSSRRTPGSARPCAAPLLAAGAGARSPSGWRTRCCSWSPYGCSASGCATGTHPTHSRIGWQAWTVTQLMDRSRETLFPLYAGLVTPVWLRLLGMRIGRGRGGVHRARAAQPDHGRRGRVPGRRHADRAVRARRRLAADRARARSAGGRSSATPG